MEADLLARIQFAFTIGFHYIFPPLTIGLAWIIFGLQSCYLKTNNKVYWEASRFWIKLFAISFVMGVATGITMEFQFGTNWATYSKFVGDIFGAPLAAEGLLAFFLESTFLGILVYGEKRVSKKMYWFSTLMIALGSTLSAFWIIVANSWQQTPAGHKIANGRAELVNFYEAVFNNSTMPRYMHVVDAALITGAMFVLGVSAYLLLKNRKNLIAQISFKHAIIWMALTVFFIFPIGHFHAKQVAINQPVKFAAYEGIWKSTTNPHLLVFAFPDPELEKNNFEIVLPGMLNVLLGKSDKDVTLGLSDVPKEDRPPIRITFFSFHLMIACFGYFALLSLIGTVLLLKKLAYTNKLFQKIALISIPIPFLANEFGWIAAEVGRQPWIVQGLLRTKDAISVSVPAYQILISLILFAILYLFIFICWTKLLIMKIKKCPIIENNEVA